MNTFYKDIEWIKFYFHKEEPFYYFPDNMTIIEFDENFGRLLTELKESGKAEEGYPEGYTEDGHGSNI